MHSTLIQQLLHPQLTSNALDLALSEARQSEIGGVCLPPFWIKKACRELQNSQVKVITAVGYPYGYQMTETKLQQIEMAIMQGSQELMVSLNLSAFKSGMPWVKIELAKCSQLIHEASGIMSVALPVYHLNQSELQGLLPICRDAGVDTLYFELSQDPAETPGGFPPQFPTDLNRGVMLKEATTWESILNLSEQGVDHLMASNILQILQAKKTA